MPACTVCMFRPGCSKTALVVGYGDLRNAEFIRDVRNFGQSLGVPAARWLDFVLELFARFEGCVVDELGQPVELNTEIFLPSDEEIDRGQASAVQVRIRGWFNETFCACVPAHVTPHIRAEALERFGLVATILRAAFPREAMMWGVRAANDNSPPIPPDGPEPRA